MEFEKLAISERKIIVGIDFGTTYSGVAVRVPGQLSIPPFICYNMD